MDNDDDLGRLRTGAAALGVTLADEAGRALLRLRDELLRWNQKVNLTAITDPGEVLEKHFLDSLAVAPHLAGAGSLLDLGAGAGFPGLPLKLALPGLQVLMVDAVAKKVGFIKHAAATLRLTGARALHARAAGKPESEGIARADVVVARALMDLGEWVKLGTAYLNPGGRLIAMLGKAPDPAEIAALQQAHGFASAEVAEYRLPLSGTLRHLATFRR